MTYYSLLKNFRSLSSNDYKSSKLGSWFDYGKNGHDKRSKNDNCENGDSKDSKYDKSDKYGNSKDSKYDKSDKYGDGKDSKGDKYDKYDKSDKYGNSKDSKGDKYDKYDKSDKYGDGKDSKDDKYDKCEEDKSKDSKYDKSDKYGDGKDSKGDKDSKYDKSDKYGDSKDSKGDKYDKYDKSDKYGDGKDSDSKSDRCEEIDAGIEINKVTNGQDDLSVVAGSAITWTYEVTNTGNVALRNVIVVDDNGTAGDTSDDFNAINFTGDNNGNGLLDPGEKWVYTVESTAVEGAYSNIGTVSADYQSTNSSQNNLRYGISHVIYRLDDGSTFKVDQYAGDVKNSADPTKYIAAIEDRTGKSVESYTIKAGQYYFDAQGNKISAVSHQADCTVNASQLRASEIKNTITITDSDASNYFGSSPVVAAAPDIDVEKYVSFDNGINWLDADTVADGPDVASGNNPQFKFVVTNIGNVALKDIVLKDDSLDLNGSAPSTNIQFATLEVGATKELIFTDAQWQLGQHTNTATVTGVYKQEVIGSPTVRHYTIDFDQDSQGNTLAAGTIIDDEYKGWGVTISTNKPYGTMIFDSANPTGGDYDLATTSEKNILIISEDGDRNDPDDEACGGSIIFKFDDAVEIKSIGLVDIEESGGKVYTTDKDGNVKVTNIPGVGNNSLQTLNIDDGDVVKVEVVLKGSGAISALNFNRVVEGSTGSETIIVSDQDRANYFGANPAIAIDKVTNGADGQEIVAGSNITWTYTVVNQGNVALANIVVTDDQEGLATYVSGDNGNSVLDTGETWIYEIQGTATLGNYANIGTVKGKYIDDLGNVVNLSQADESSYFGFEEFIPNPAIAIDKVTNGADGQAILAGSNITWTYTVINEGNTALSNVTVTDDQEGIATYVSGDNGNGILDAAETWVYEIQGTAGVGNYSNLGTVTGQYVNSSGNVTNLLASDGSGYFGANPAIAMDKVTNGADGQEILAGSNITWTYTVINEGNTALSNVTVTDDKEGVATYVSGDNGNGILDVAETWIYKIQGTAGVGNYGNTGTVTAKYVDDLDNVLNLSSSDDSSYYGFEEEIIGCEPKAVIDIDYPALNFNPNLSSSQYPNLLSGSFYLIPQGDTCIDNLTVKYTISTNIEGGQVLSYDGAIDRLWLDNGNYVKDAGDTLITDRTNLDISLGAGVFQQVFFELDSTAIKLAGGSVLSGVAQVNTGTPFASSLTLFG